jgi:hypothetical protein
VCDSWSLANILFAPHRITYILLLYIILPYIRFYELIIFFMLSSRCILVYYYYILSRTYSPPTVCAPLQGDIATAAEAVRSRSLINLTMGRDDIYNTAYRNYTNNWRFGTVRLRAGEQTRRDRPKQLRASISVWCEFAISKLRIGGGGGHCRYIYIYIYVIILYSYLVVGIHIYISI